MTARQQITAVIKDRKGRVLSIGQNSYVKTHPLQKKYAEVHGLIHKIFLHAEMSAIVRCKDLEKAHSIYITRFNKKGQAILAAPCPLCASAIEAAGIKKIFHT